MKIVPDIYISDLDTVKRTWKERLFSFPWAPFKSHKTIENPKVYCIDNTYFVSTKTFETLLKEWKSGNE